MSAETVEQDADDAVDLLIRRYGYDGAEGRLLYCLSQVRRRKAEDGGSND